MLRFRTTYPTIKSLTYLTYKLISNTLNLTYNEVQNICKKSLKHPRVLSLKEKAHKLDQRHFNFLLCPRTLELWAGLTLKERSKMFHRKFPHKRIVATSLRRLYLKNKIKRKQVRQEKKLPMSTSVNFQQRCVNLLHEIAQVKEQGRMIVYLDETLFNQKAIALKEWSG